MKWIKVKHVGAAVLLTAVASALPVVTLAEDEASVNQSASVEHVAEQPTNGFLFASLSPYVGGNFSRKIGENGVQERADASGFGINIGYIPSVAPLSSNWRFYLNNASGKTPLATGGHAEVRFTTLNASYLFDFGLALDLGVGRGTYKDPSVSLDGTGGRLAIGYRNAPKSGFNYGILLGGSSATGTHAPTNTKVSYGLSGLEIELSYFFGI